MSDPADVSITRDSDGQSLKVLAWIACEIVALGSLQFSTNALRMSRFRGGSPLVSKTCLVGMSRKLNDSVNDLAFRINLW